MVTAAEVLDIHAGLHDRTAHPSQDLKLYASGFAEVSRGNGGDTWQMFYPFYDVSPGSLYGKPSPGWEGRFWSAVAHGLFEARTYQVTAEMCQAAEAMHARTAEKVQHYEAQEPPSAAGFLWLDQPFTRPDRRGKAIATRVLTWRPQVTRLRARGSSEVYVSDGVHVICWGYAPDHDDYTDALPPDLGRRLGDLTMTHSMVMPFGERFGSFSSPAGLSTAGGYLHTLWMLLGTEMPASSRLRLPRHAYRRALRSIRHGEVNVITLRRTAPHPDSHGHHEVDWSCRWVVQGFWRHLDDYSELAAHHRAVPDGRGYCAACPSRVTWVSPHIRGPEDKPLKVTRDLYRLSR